MSIFEVLLVYKSGLSSGLLVTLQMCLFIWSIGLLLGVLIGFGSVHCKRLGRGVEYLSFLNSGVPVIVLLFWVHYPLQEMLQFTIQPFYTAIFTLAFVNVLGVAEVVKNSILDIPKQYLEVARVSGISAYKRFLRIDLPLIFRHSVAPILMLQVNMLHMTLFASLIGVEDLFRVVQRINAIIYKPVEAYTALVFFYIAISIPLCLAARLLKARYACDFSEK